MRDFNAEEISGLRATLESMHCPEVEANVGGRTFKYFVVPPHVKPRLPNFVVRSKDGSVYGISSEVRPEFRPYAVFHELIEFDELGIDVRGRCRTAMDIEMNAVPENIKLDYARMRHQFFQDLIHYARANPKNFTDEDIVEMKDTFKGLEALI